MSSMMMASSICALVFEYTSEEALLNRPDFNYSTLRSLYVLIARCLSSSEQVHCEFPFITNCKLVQVALFIQKILLQLNNFVRLSNFFVLFIPYLCLCSPNRTTGCVAIFVGYDPLTIEHPWSLFLSLLFLLEI